jgi:hypothetical protein
MATGSLAPEAWLTPLDDNGNIVPGGKLQFYDAGTVTPRAVYTDYALTVPHANPVVLDAAGRAVVYLEARTYKIVFQTAAGVTIKTVDNVPSTALVLSGLGEIATLGGDPNYQVTNTSYPSGAGGETIHKGSLIVNIDSAILASGGTFRLEAMLRGEDGGTITIGLVNLSDGAPDTALVEISSSSTTGARAQSGAITFPAGGAAKNLAYKSKVNTGAGYAWGARWVRTA